MNFKNYIRPGKGASDVTPLLVDKDAFAALIDAFTEKVEGIKIDKVACIEARGFLFGAAVAYKLKVGVIPLRKENKLPNELFTETFIDYSGKEKKLEMHVDALKEGESILIIDDWVETGASIKAAIKLIEAAKGRIVGICAFVDDSSDELKEVLSKYHYQYIDRVLPEDNF